MASAKLVVRDVAVAVAAVSGGNNCQSAAIKAAITGRM